MSRSHFSGALGHSGGPRFPVNATVESVAGLRISNSWGRGVYTVALSVLALGWVAMAEGRADAREPSPPRVEPSVVASSDEETSEAIEQAVGASAQRAREAENGQSKAAEREYFAHPYGLVEFGIGVMALPDAKLCGGGIAGCDRGDVSIEVDAWPMFRASPSFAVGAGMTLALIPMQEVPRLDTTFPREHARRYFTAEGIGRYYFVHGPSMEVWSGISAGLIVVSDNFRSRSKAPEVTIIGASSANIATEGLSMGLANGITFGVNRHLQVGATLRFAIWYLPPTPDVIAFGEVASLSNRVTMLNLALTVAYHSH
jgi:hypothetical protein